MLKLEKSEFRGVDWVYFNENKIGQVCEIGRFGDFAWSVNTNNPDLHQQVVYIEQKN